MRATRAYLAGFGTSGSLLAGAAALFLLGSAIVAFKGWPQIGAGSATSSVTAAPIPASSPIARRLSIVIAATHAHPATARVARAGVRSATTGLPAGARPSGGGPGGGGSPGTTSVQPSAGSAASSSGTSTVVPSVAGCGSCSGSSDLVRSLGDAVTRTASTVGTDVGTQIKSLGVSAAGQAGSISPPAGNTVATTSSTVADTVTGATNTVTSVLASATGGGH